MPCDQNETCTSQEQPTMTWDDATWILTSSFIIFTMQSGFGLLEAGCVSAKNEVNIMVKNAVDVVFGGVTYWAFGYGLTFGQGPYSNPFCGVGSFLLDSENGKEMGIVYSTFIFQLSFATTATTIVSGAMAERTKLTAYILYSLTNTWVYCVSAHWLWVEGGFLRDLGVIDIAGSGGVHVLGAVSALVAAIMLGPRRGKYDGGELDPPGNPTNSLIGMFMLWWGWLGFNCGSTFGISGGKWILAAKSAVTTITASMGGGVSGMLLSCILNKNKFLVPDIVNSILSSLVSVTAGCAAIRPWEAIISGSLAAIFSFIVNPVFKYLQIDDPVGAFAVHGVGGIWGMLVVGLFADIDPIENVTRGRAGLFHGGGAYLLGVQILAIVCISTWSAVCSLVLLSIIKKTVGLRMSLEDEILGADYVEHGLKKHGTQIDIKPNRPRRRSSFGFQVFHIN